MKLNQLLAVEKGEKNRAQKMLTELHRKSQKESLYDGRVRTYKPFNEDDRERLPQEVQKVQLRSGEVLQELQGILSPVWDLTASKDWTNATEACADIVISKEGKSTVLLKSVPVTYLLYLEKQLNDVITFITKLPTLDPSEEWKFSQVENCYATSMSWTNRSKKVIRNHVKAEATKEHPAQVETYAEDVVVGNYEAIRYSGALTMNRKTELLDRAHSLKDAVLRAREEANLAGVVRKEAADPLFGYLFGSAEV
jgi:hypothetical protein